jgi:3-hydroxyisobutyrate dehydrogenase-like beta-hydroxyacid dehydrogenase
MGFNLLKAGWPLTVWNRTPEKAERLAKAGARVAPTPRAAAEGADVVITIVSDPAAVEQVAWGPDGLLQGLRKGAVYIDSSTVSPALARRLAEAAGGRGADFLDAPVTGGTWGAEKGELVFIAGGEAATLERVEPVLSSMGTKIFHLGPHGAGQTVKLAMNMILALQVDALAEALALVQASGLRREGLIEVLQSSMARAGVLDMKAPMILQDEFPPSFPLRLMHKDLGLALELAGAIGIPLPATSAAREVYSAVKGSAQYDIDYAGVARFWKTRFSAP